MELPVGYQSSRTDFWRSQIEQADKFNGTIKEYCLKNGLNPGTLNAYRKKLGYSKPKRRVQKRLAFSQVQVQVARAVQDPEPSSCTLPDPKWLAAFLKAWKEGT